MLRVFLHTILPSDNKGTGGDLGWIRTICYFHLFYRWWQTQNYQVAKDGRGRWQRHRHRWITEIFGCKIAPALISDIEQQYSIILLSHFSALIPHGPQRLFGNASRCHQLNKICPSNIFCQIVSQAELLFRKISPNMSMMLIFASICWYWTF